jgi:hypothetical protein
LGTTKRLEEGDE